MDTQDQANYHAWIHFVSTSLYPRREEKQGFVANYMERGWFKGQSPSNVIE